MANVLIVEDSKSAAAAQAYSLWEQGHTVTFAYTAREAEACFRNVHHEVVLLDFDLPDATGLEVFRALRQVDPDVCVVMVTGKGNECLAAQILKEGARDYIPKTSELTGILPEVVERIIRERKSREYIASLEDELRQVRAELAEAKARLREECLDHKLARERLDQLACELNSAGQSDAQGDAGRA